MKRTLAITLTCVALAGARADATSESATHAAHAHHAAVKATKAMIHYAPADEYFGPGKMSLLGIRNQLHDLTLQYDVNHDAAQSVFGKTKYAEACLRDWSKKYPADPAIPRHIYLLGHLYGRLAFLPGGPQRESNAQSWLLYKYPKTWYAKDEKKRMIVERKEEEERRKAAVQATPMPSSMPTEAAPGPQASGMTTTGTPAPAMTATPASIATPSMPVMPTSISTPMPMMR